MGYFCHSLIQTMEPVTGWIIYPRYTADRSDNAFGWLVGEAAAAGMRLEVLFVEELSVVYGTRCGIFHKGRKSSRCRNSSSCGPTTLFFRATSSGSESE